MPQPNLLFISIAFPPKSDPECIQSARYFKALKLTNAFNIQALTSSSPTLFMDEDKSLDKYIEPADNIQKIKIIEWKITNWVLRKFMPHGIDWPDSKFSFHMQWKQAINKVTKPDIIYSRSFPLSSTLMAYKLVNHFNTPWVLHLSDPWSISPIHSRTEKNQKFQEEWEKKSFEKATYICLTSKATINAYKKKYPSLSKKFQLIPNVPYEQQKNEPINWKGKLKISYTGGLAGLRSPEKFLKALEQSIKTHPEIENSIEVVFAGNIDKDVKNIFSTSKLTCIKHLGNISLNQSIKLQQSSHILLSIDNPITKGEQAMFIPSKLYDYINSNRKVLALTTNNSASDDFLTDFNADILTFEHISNLQSILLNYIIKLKEKDEVFFTQPNKLPAKLEVANNAINLSSLLNKSLEAYHA